MLKKIVSRPGINRENTRYYTEAGFYDCDKIRFRQGSPEVIGGWQRISDTTYLGVCRSIWNWVTLYGYELLGVGTNLKFYTGRGGAYFDVTPIRNAVTLSSPFTATAGSAIITVTHTNHGALDGDFVSFYNAASLGGNITATLLNTEHQITYIGPNSYSITVPAVATAGDTGHGGSPRAVYQINVGAEIGIAQVGWDAGAWGYGSYGFGGTSTELIRLWSQSNFGQDLIFAPRRGSMYYWFTATGLEELPSTFTVASPCVATVANSNLFDLMPVSFTSTGQLPTGLEIGTVYYVRNFNPIYGSFNLSATANGALINTSGTQSGTHALSIRGVSLTALAGASDVPVVQNYSCVSDIYRFVFAFGCNDYTSATQDPMLIRWSDQEDAANWTPAATNQAGSLRLSHGSEIVTAVQTRQEIVVLTDSSVYALQYLGPPYVWGAQLVGDNISIISQNAAITASGVLYWMGFDKFYKYDGRIQTLRCDLRSYIYTDINRNQFEQVFSGTNEGFNELWWFYCSADSNVIDRYVIYNYIEDIWYYGTMSRTAWLDSGTLAYPLAATYLHNLVEHENGLNNSETATPQPISAYITSSEFDIDDGHNFGYVWRIIPDLTFRGSTANAPTATMSLIPLNNSGAGYTNPPSVGGVDYGAVTRTAVLPIEKYTGQLNIRVRGRQLAFKIESNQLDTTWQLGAPRIDIKQDGKRG